MLAGPPCLLAGWRRDRGANSLLRLWIKHARSRRAAMSLAARLDGIKIQGHRCAIRKKCALQKKGASTFWAATRLAPRGKTPRWRLRLPPRLTGSSSVPTTSRNVPNARSSSATGSRAVFPLEGIDAAPVASESHGGRGAVVLAARVLRGFGRCGLRRGSRQAGPGR